MCVVALAASAALGGWTEYSGMTFHSCPEALIDACSSMAMSTLPPVELNTQVKRGAAQAPDGADHHSRGRELVQDLVGALTHGPLDVGGVQACAHDQHGPAGARLAQLPDQVDAVAVRQAQIQNHHVELGRRGLASCLGEGPGLGDHLEVGLPFQQGHQKVPEI
jgi:hypothetical protein